MWWNTSPMPHRLNRCATGGRVTPLQVPTRLSVPANSSFSPFTTWVPTSYAETMADLQATSIAGSLTTAVSNRPTKLSVESAPAPADVPAGIPASAPAMDPEEEEFEAELMAQELAQQRAKEAALKAVAAHKAAASAAAAAEAAR